MKYTKQQAERLKEKGMDGYTRYDRPLPDVTIKDGYYIIESKMNKHTFSNLDNDKYKNFSVTKPK